MHSLFFLFTLLSYQHVYTTFPKGLQQLSRLELHLPVISYDESSKRYDSGIIDHISFIVVDQAYKVTCDDDVYFITVPHQQCMLYDSHQWRETKHLVSGDKLLCRDSNFVTVAKIEIIKKRIHLCEIIVAPHHTFFATERGILMHNNEAVVAVGALALTATLVPPVIPIITTIKCVGLVGLFGTVLWNLFGKKKNGQNNCKESNLSSSGAPASPPPQKPDDDDENEFKKRHPHGRYEDAPYHKNHQSGRKSPRPIDGQKALDNSFAIEGTNDARVGVSNKEIVMFRTTRPGIYHGYVVKANDKNAASAIATLVKHGIIKLNGKFIQ
jgi:hypothetical protein